MEEGREVVGVIDGVTVRDGDIERFHGFVYPDPNSGCFIWGGAETKAGKGARERVYAHRMAWFIAHGSLPSRLLLLRHKCHQRFCCNPDHLIEGTDADNALDKARAGRGTKSKIGMPYGVSRRIRRGKRSPTYAVKIGGNGKAFRAEFSSLEVAAKAARAARERIYGKVFSYA